MKRKEIIFEEPQKVIYVENSLPTMTDESVIVKMQYTVISGGTERANLMAEKNTWNKFPMKIGYCGVGVVEKIGALVKNVGVGDRVLVYHGIHTSINLVHYSNVTKVDDDGIDSLEAAFVVIASMGLGGVRKLELELGESAMVMGLGLLGIFSLQFLARSGANPLIAVDLNEQRRELALRLGADYALNPADEDFVEQVKLITKGKGVNACVEVTGSSKAMAQALDCASRMGRISLLGCTRESDCKIDYYQKVHLPGIKLIGAHNFIRPKDESYPHHWTHHDDCRAILDLISAKKVQVKPIVSRVVKPENAPQIYKELCEDKNFPIGTVFDWREVN